MHGRSEVKDGGASANYFPSLQFLLLFASHPFPCLSSFPSLVSQEIIVLVENAKNETLLCPLCGGVFRDPYIATCGHSFCRPCYSGRTELCPLDNSPLSMVVRNLAIADQVGELLIHCRYGCKPAQDCPGEYEVDSTGCQMIIKVASREYVQ